MSNPAPRRRPSWRIVIAGGGIPSLAFALAVTRALGDAVSVTVVDPRQGRPDPRAFAISPASVAMLEGLGLWDEVRPRTRPIAAMRITDSRPEDAIRPDYLGFGGRPGQDLGFIVEADALALPLVEAARAHGVGFLSGSVSRAEPDGLAIEVVLQDGERRAASLLVAADGARSQLREQAGIGWVGRRYGQSAITGTVAHETDGGGLAVQHFLPNGPFAILPLAGPGRAGPYRSSIVWAEETGQARRLLASAPDLAAALALRFGSELGAVTPEAPFRAYPLAVGLARRFVATRLALLGDAAHEVHPLAGQGLNLALGDAASLAEHVVDAVRLGLDPGDTEALAAYERDRRGEALRLAALTDGLNALFSNDLLPVRAIRDVGLGIVDRSAVLKTALVREAAGTTARAPRLMRGRPL